MKAPKALEINTIDSKDYCIRASWETRTETPDALAARFLRMIDAFKAIDPAFSLWNCGAKRPKKFELVRQRYAEEVAEGISRDDWGEPTPVYGYRFGAITRETPDNRSFVVRCHAGATVDRPFPNDVIFENFSMANLEPDASVVCYRVFRPALLAVVDAWSPVRAGAYSYRLIRSYAGDLYFPPVWIQYLCPWLAQKITPPSSVIAETLPNGGLLMTATTETFDVDNPAHLAAAQDMAAAMAPLNELPWPSRR
jgi:hypothetical protein